ncbi:MAG: selenium cofactor biosynthesis protein YqeC [Myxococcota bacterium]
MSLSEALGLEARDVVAFVGAGGKTTALRWLGVERAAVGERVVLLTTTKIERQAGLRTVLAALAREVETLGGPWPVLVVTADLGTRLRGVPPELVDELARGGGGFRLLVQADGAARRAFKAPDAFEPVVPSSATVVVSVVGLDVLGVPLDFRRVHRPERVAALTGAAVGSAVSPQIIATVLLHPDGGGKGVPPGARRVAILNKVESDDAWGAARAIAHRLAAAGITTLAGSLRDGALNRLG